MIDKKIHYIWFGNKQKPKKVLKCIESWKKNLPDYEIIEWNEETFNIEAERKNNKFLDECYKRKLWAFVADYVRVKILYEQGGIYMDTDIEVIKDLTPLLNTQLFCGIEYKNEKGFAILGSCKKHKVLEKMLKFYENDVWNSSDFIITDILTKTIDNLYGKKIRKNEEITIYPTTYFYPFKYGEKFTPDCLTENTYTIHWWEQSWGSNPKIYFLKYKHYPIIIKQIKHACKLFSFYIKKYLKIKI